MTQDSLSDKTFIEMVKCCIDERSEAQATDMSFDEWITHVEQAYRFYREQCLVAKAVVPTGSECLIHGAMCSLGAAMSVVVARMADMSADLRMTRKPGTEQSATERMTAPSEN